MTNNHLPQAILVEQLLGLVAELIPKLPEDNFKQRLLSCLKEFEVVMTPSTINLDEIYKKALSEHIVISHKVAVEILINAANDINQNYAINAIKYHVDEYICSTLSPS